MFGYVYKTTNLINGKIYIGKHKSPTHDKAYFGSGVILLNAINKYGIINFTNEIIEWCDSLEELNAREIYWIGYYKKLDYAMYNISNGGDGGDIYHCLSKEQQKEFVKKSSILGKKLPPRSDVSKQKQREKMLGRPSPNKGRKMSEAQKEKLRKSHLGQTPWNKGKKMSAKYIENNRKSHLGQVVSEETKSKMSKSRQGHFVSLKTRQKISNTLTGTKRKKKGE